MNMGLAAAISPSCTEISKKSDKLNELTNFFAILLTQNILCVGWSRSDWAQKPIGQQL